MYLDCITLHYSLSIESQKIFCLTRVLGDVLVGSMSTYISFYANYSIMFCISFTTQKPRIEKEKTG